MQGTKSQPVQLIVYGDFNCPFSALASARARVLELRGDARVDWRAVEHAPDIPPEGNPVTGAVGDELAGELDQIRGLLVAGEPDPLALPPVLPNTNRATAAFAATPEADRPALRSRLFGALWSDGTDLGDADELAALGLSASDPATAAGWRDEWLALERRLVPMMILPDGYVSRGLGALARLADLIERGDADRAG